MKTEFTNEELYAAYSEAVAEELVEEYGIQPYAVEKLFLHVRFKERFLAHPEHFEFLEPGTLARIFMDK